MCFSLDTNNAGGMIDINWGCTTNNGNPQVRFYTFHNCQSLDSNLRQFNATDPRNIHVVSLQDCSELPLFASVDPAVESLSTFAAFTALFDNYKPSPGEVEEQTEEELAEEARFLDEVAATEVMRTTYQFLVDRGEVIIQVKGPASLCST